MSSTVPWVSSDPTQVDGPDYEQSPAVAVLADGTYVVGWTEYHPERDGTLAPYTAVAQHFDAAGNAMGGEFQLSESAVAWPALRLESTADGGFVALWAGGNQDGMTFGAGGSAPSGHTPATMSHIERKFDASGHALSPEITLSPPATVSTPGALIREQHLAGGGTVVAWNGTNQADAYAFQLLDAQGNATGGPTAFGHDPEAGTVPGQYSVPLAMDVAPTPDGGFVAMYAVQRSNTNVPGSTSASYLQHFDASGAAMGALTPVPDARAVAVLAGGDILLAGFPGGHQIELTRIDSSGVVISDTTYALPGGGQADLGPSGASLTVLADVGWLLSWEQDTPVPGQMLPVTQLYGERFDAQGNVVGSADLIATFGNGTEAYDVKATPDGGVEYAWGNFKGAPAGSEYLDAYIQHFGPAASAPAPGPTGMGTSGDDTLVGTSGNDRLDGVSGNDSLDGREGTDTAVIEASVASVLSYALGNGTATVTTSVGTDTLVDIERVQFNDALFALDTNVGGHVWQAAALFHAGFGVLPGMSDLSHWTAAADASTSMSALAQHMLDQYAPGISTSDLVASLYQQIVHETASAETVQSYVEQVGAGKTFATQAELVAWAANASLNTDAIAAIVGTVQQLDPSAF